MQKEVVKALVIAALALIINILWEPFDFQDSENVLFGVFLPSSIIFIAAFSAEIFSDWLAKRVKPSPTPEVSFGAA